MFRTSEELAHRRRQLILESEAIRRDFSEQGQILRHNLASIDVGVSFLSRLRRQPALIAGLAFGLIILRPQRLLYKAQVALNVWQGVQRALPVALPLVQALLQKWRTPK